MPGLLTLRIFKGPVITVRCKPCGQQVVLHRKALVKQFGASMRFVDLRRRIAMGCDKMQCSDGQDRCGTQFSYAGSGHIDPDTRANAINKALSLITS